MKAEPRVELGNRDRIAAAEADRSTLPSGVAQFDDHRRVAIVQRRLADAIVTSPYLAGQRRQLDSTFGTAFQLHADPYPAAGDRVPATVPPVQRTVDDVLEKLGDEKAVLLQELNIDEEQLKKAIVASGLDKREKDKLPGVGSLGVVITDYFERLNAPKSPYTGLAYSDVVYEANRKKVAVALDLDAGYKGLGADKCIAKLFDHFCKRPFKYTMQAGGFDTFAAGRGDCKTLVQAFATVAQQELGIAVKVGEEARSFFLPEGGKTIDPGAYGTSDEGVNWFFSNHYWIEYGGAAYDLLFGHVGVNTGAFDIQKSSGNLLTLEGKDAGRKYYRMTSGRLVWDNPGQKPGPNPTNFSSGDESALGKQGLKLPG